MAEGGILLARRTLTRELEEFKCDIVVSAATTLMGLQRAAMMEQGLLSGEPNILRRMFSWLQWPVIKSATLEGHLAWLEYPESDENEASVVEEPVWVQVDIHDLTVDQYLDCVPEVVAMDWLALILELNPHWERSITRDDGSDDDDPAKKKKE